MKSIRAKLWAAMMVLVIITLVLLWFFQIVFLEEFYTNIRVNEIKNASYKIMNDFENNNIKDLEEELDFFAYNNNLSIEVVDSTGNMLYRSVGINNNSHKMMRQTKLQDQNFSNILSGEEIEAVQTHHRFGNEIINLGLPIELADDIKGVFYISMPLAPVTATAAILKQQLLYITITLLLVSLIISFIISRSFLKPIFKIKKTAEKIAAGDLSHRIASTSKDELGQLANTINYMGEELAKTEDLRKELVANMSHELRTPLALIQGYAETVRDVSGNTPIQREKHLNIIIEESEALSKMVDDILDLSQAQAGYLNLNLQKTSLNNLINQVISKYELLSKETGIKILSNCPSEIDLVIDAAKIEQVFVNIIDNAFKHTPKDGQISIEAIKENSFVKVEINDTGEGISEADLNSIWDRYYKSANTSQSKASGTGLGLSIVKNILEAHGANYGVTSKKNLGTTFWFKFKNELR